MLTFLHEVVLHSLIEVLPVVIILFLTYLIMELVEDKLTTIKFDTYSSNNILTNFIFGLLGLLPTCAIPSLGVNLFLTNIINIGTLVTIFLSTSDDMLQVMMASGTSIVTILIVVLYKLIVSVVIGCIVCKLFKTDTTKNSIQSLCDEHKCHCKEHNVIKSTLIHTVITTLFIVTSLLIVNTIMYFGGTTFVENILQTSSILKYCVASLIGLIPCCGPSIIATTLYCEGIVTLGTMLSTVFSSCGVGLILFARLQHQKRQVIIIASILLVSGIVFGALFDVLNNFVTFIWR